MTNYQAAMQYQAAWLDVPVERLQGESYVNPTSKRSEMIKGYSSPVRAHVLQLEGRKERYAACVSGLEKKLKRKKMSHHKFFWFDALNPAIDYPRVRQLSEADLPAFMCFHERAYPEASDRSWVLDYFHSLVAQRRCFGIYEDDELVSVADSPQVPYLSELVVEPGIMTLPDARKKGYASAVCAAFIQAQLQQGLCQYGLVRQTTRVRLRWHSIWVFGSLVICGECS